MLHFWYLVKIAISRNKYPHFCFSHVGRRVLLILVISLPQTIDIDEISSISLLHGNLSQEKHRFGRPLAFLIPQKSGINTNGKSRIMSRYYLISHLFWLLSSISTSHNAKEQSKKYKTLMGRREGPETGYPPTHRFKIKPKKTPRVNQNNRKMKRGAAQPRGWATFQTSSVGN